MTTKNEQSVRSTSRARASAGAQVKAASSPKAGAADNAQAQPAARDTPTARPKRAPRVAWPNHYDRCLELGGYDASTLAALTKKERALLAIGLFYFQMLRNSAQFWIHNGFGASWTRELRARLKDLGTPTSLEVAAMAADLSKIGRRAYRREDVLERSEGDDDDDPILADCAERCARIDERFSQLAPTLTRELDAFCKAPPAIRDEALPPSRRARNA